MFYIKQINIPQPCSQSWQQMEQREQGRHCAQCAKTVVDFTRMTNDEILTYLTGASHVCGRFTAAQLSGINQLAIEESVKSFNWKRWLVAAGLFGAGLIGRANAQTKPALNPTEQAPVDSARKSVAQTDDANSRQVSNRIQGVVIGADDKLPIPGATIRIKGTNSSVQSDVSGKFNITATTANAILVISEIGYTTQEIVASAGAKKELKIKLQSPGGLMGEVVITKTVPVQPRVLMLYQYIPWPVNRLFK